MHQNITPGPWKVEDWGHCLAVVTDMHAVVTDATCYPNFETKVGPQKWANSHLIAASPEMLDALIAIRDELNSLLSDEDLTESKLREASEGLLPSLDDRANTMIWKALNKKETALQSARCPTTSEGFE